jgi:CRISPR/Cas system Type II protein with McrA/HNH and RuvC-like nuclease domain
MGRTWIAGPEPFETPQQRAERLARIEKERIERRANRAAFCRHVWQAFTRTGPYKRLAWWRKWNQ